MINQPSDLKKWYRYFLFALVVIIGLGIIATGFQALTWFFLKKEQRSLKKTLLSYNQVTSEYNQLTNHEKILKKKLAKISKHLSNPADPSTILKMVKAQLKESNHLEQIVYASQITQLAILADAKNIGTLCLTLPQALSCTTLHMCSLEYHENNVKAILKNTTQKKNKAT